MVYLLVQIENELSVSRIMGRVVAVCVVLLLIAVVVKSIWGGKKK
jgi:hypothetical protein